MDAFPSRHMGIPLLAHMMYVYIESSIAQLDCISGLFLRCARVSIDSLS